MAVTRASIIRGPGKVTWNGVNFWSKDDIQPKPMGTYNGIECSAYDISDETLDDARVEVDLSPFGLWQNLAVLYPAWLLNPVKGMRLFGDTDLPLTVWGTQDSQLLAVANNQLMTPPPLALGPTADLYGAAKFVGLVPNGVDLGASATPIYSVQAGQADPGGNFAMTNYSRQRWGASWGTISGFAAFQAEEKWDISFEVSWKPVLCQKLTVDYALEKVRVMAKCKPVGPTAIQIAAAMHLNDKAQGSRLADTSANCPDLVLTAGAKSVTVKSAALKTGGYRFGALVLRNDEVGFMATSAPTAGVMNALFAIA